MGLNRDILKLALPAVLNNITVPLLGLCDTAIAGHLGNASFIGAISVGAMMLNVIYWLCGFLRMGTSGITANALGANDMPRVRDVLGKSLLIALAISALVLAFHSPLRNLLLSFIAPDEGVKDLASQYFNICVFTVPAQLAVMALSGWFVGLQNTWVPMVVAVGINLINIAMSLSLVFGFGLGFAGIAIGTLTANWIGVMGAMLFMLSKLKQLKNNECQSHSIPSDANDSHPISKGEGLVKWKEFFALNGNLFFRSACIMGVSLTITAVGARIGEVELAANAVMMQFFIFFSYFMDGFAFAGEALVGKDFGAHNLDHLRKTIAAILKWGAGMALAFTMIYFVGAEKIISFLTDDARVIEFVGGMKGWLAALPFITVSAFLFDGIFIGIVDTKSLLITTLIAAIVFFLLILSEGKLTRSDSMLWAAFESYLFARGILLAARLASYFQRWKKFGIG